VRSISKVVGEVNELQSTIAAAVEEQAATSAEMNRSVGQVASGSKEIAQAVSKVAGEAKATSEGAGQSRTAADQLTEIAGSLQRELGRFRIDGKQGEGWARAGPFPFLHHPGPR